MNLMFYYKNTDYPSIEGLNLALDTYADLERITEVSTMIKTHDLFAAKNISNSLQNIDIEIPGSKLLHI